MLGCRGQLSGCLDPDGWRSPFLVDPAATVPSGPSVRWRGRSFIDHPGARPRRREKGDGFAGRVLIEPPGPV